MLPFASGATVFYNYRDLQIKNGTPHTFQIRLWLSAKCLEGSCASMRCCRTAITSTSVSMRFCGGSTFRQNELWRDTIDKRASRVVHTGVWKKNFAEVKYVPAIFQSEAGGGGGGA